MLIVNRRARQRRPPLGTYQMNQRERERERERGGLHSVSSSRKERRDEGG